MTALAEKSLLNFLENPSFRVLVIKGSWGAGKTFFWRRFVQQQSEGWFKAYAYASLFGIRDAAELKQQLFSNFRMLDESGLSRHLEKLKPLAAMLKPFQIPYVNSAAAVNGAIEWVIDNFLICVDDLERKESSLPGAAVLGLISQWVEERNCKVVLIYNEDRLDDLTRRQIDEYREKVVDLEITYSPSIESNLGVIWSEGCPDFVARMFGDLSLNNIRIMQRVKWALDYFSQLQDEYPYVASTFMRNCCALTILHHAFPCIFPLRDLSSQNIYALLHSKGKEEQAKAADILSKLEYRPNELDRIIFDYLLQGYADVPRDRKLLLEMNERERVTGIQEKHHAAWAKFYSTFNVSQAEFVAHHVAFLRENADDLFVREVYESVNFLKQLDESLDLGEYVRRAVDRFVAQVDELDEYALSSARMQPDLQALILSEVSKKSERHKHTVSELIQELAGRDGWNSHRIGRMLVFTEEDYFEWIISEKEQDVPRLLKTFLRRFGTNNENERLVVERMRSAIQRVKQRSELDRLRVEKIVEG